MSRQRAKSRDVFTGVMIWFDWLGAHCPFNAWVRWKTQRF